MIINDIAEDNNKVLEYEIKKTVTFHRLESSMKESVSTFQSVVEAEQRDEEPQQNLPLSENGNSSIIPNK